MNIRPAQLDDIPVLDGVARLLAHEIGFVSRMMLRQGIDDGETIMDADTGSFVRFHKRRDGVTVVYEIAVPKVHQGNGIGKALIAKLDLPLRAKCPFGNPSNRWYQRTGWTHVGTENGRSRKLLIWEKKK